MDADDAWKLFGLALLVVGIAGVLWLLHKAEV